MKSHFFALVSRMRHIYRWGLMRNTQLENVQEHSLMVAQIAHALAVIRRDVFGGEASPDRCASLAMYHDATEIFTGDLPTPIKYMNRDITTAYKAVEEGARARLLAMLPAELRGSYSELLSPDESSGDWRLVKAADRLSAYIKCVEEKKAGNTEFLSAADGILSSIDALELPEAGYSMEHFMQSFELSLDEQDI